MEEMRIADCGLRNLEALAEPVAATCLSDIVRLTASAVYHKGRRRIPLHPRFRIGRKTLTGLLVSKRPQTAVAIGPHHLKSEWPGTKAGTTDRGLRIAQFRRARPTRSPDFPLRHNPLNILR